MGFVLLLAISAVAYPQTAGTFSFSVTTTSTGGFSPEHFLAIWIENGAGTFIKTKIRYTNSGDLDHMQTWVNKSGQNVVDATTGGTLTSHGTITFMWNGTNVAGTQVTDGQYLVWLEMSWASSLTSGKTVNSYPFTKGPSPFHSTPTNTVNFLNIILDWAPSTTGISGEMENQDVKVYPVPTSAILNVEFKYPVDALLVEFIDENGRVVHNERFTAVSAGKKIFDLSGFANGAYYVNLRFPEKTLVFRIIVAR